jgi:hypothetical protein
VIARVSRRLIKAHQYYSGELFNMSKRIRIEGKYYYQEFFIPTVARLQSLTVATYDYTDMNISSNAMSEDDLRCSIARGTRIFHAVKHDSRVLTTAKSRRRSI